MNRFLSCDYFFKFLSPCLFFVFASAIAKGQIKEGAVNVLLSEGLSQQQIHTTYRENGKTMVSFVHPGAAKIFSKYKITKFERTYPGVERYNHPNAKILSRYYTIEGNFKRDRVMYDILKDAEKTFEDVEPLSDPITNLQPNDYALSGNFYHSHLDHVNAKQAWDITQGSRSIKVAVTDPRGFYFEHPDYVNSNQTNQILYHSTQAIDHSQSTLNTPEHGLNVASVVGMATNNGVGISAIGYKTGVMAFFADYNEMLSASYDHGADVVEASWSRTDCSFHSSEQLIINMIHDNGTIIVAAAGNGNADQTCSSPDGQFNGYQYPASYDHVISVGGVSTDDLYVWNGLGVTKHFTLNNAVDLMAPAIKVGMATVLLDLQNSDPASRTNVVSRTYTEGQGTSLAAPMVAGLAALILSISPDLPPDEVEDIIKSTSVNLDNLPGNAAYAGLAGSGRIDAYAAVRKTSECYACTAIDTYPQYEEGTGVQLNLPYNTTGCKIQVGQYTVQPTETITMTGSKEIRLLPGFKTVSGSVVKLAIEDICKNVNVGSRTRNMSSETKHVTYQERILSGEIAIPEDVAYDEIVYAIKTYPNPAKDNVTIKYSLPSASHVTLEITDTMGNILSTPVEGVREKGGHEVIFNVSSLKQGVYLLVLKSNSGEKLDRIVVVH